MSREQLTSKPAQEHSPGSTPSKASADAADESRPASTEPIQRDSRLSAIETADAKQSVDLCWDEFSTFSESAWLERLIKWANSFGRAGNKITDVVPLRHATAALRIFYLPKASDDSSKPTGT